MYTCVLHMLSYIEHLYLYKGSTVKEKRDPLHVSPRDALLRTLQHSPGPC